MDELLSLSDLFQWIAKAGLVAGLIWIYLQAQAARDKNREEVATWRKQMELESKHKDELHDKDIQHITETLNEHLERDNRIFKSLKEMDNKLDSITERMIKIETVLEIDAKGENK